MMSLASSVKQILDAAVSGPNGPAGLVFGAVDRNGKFLVAEASGRLGLDKDEPMTTESYFPLYSVTKSIVGIAAMQLVEQGKLALDEPAEQYLPAISELQVVDDDGVLRAPKRKITLRMLLTHTAGLGYTFFNHRLRKFWESRGGPDEFNGTREGLLDFPLVNEPGEIWGYSTGLDWTGEIIAQVSGLTLSEYCSKNIFTPLGINDMGFAVPSELRPRLVSLHRRKENGTVEVIDHLPFIHGASVDSGGAGSFGTLRSFLTMLAAVINGGVGPNGARILNSDTVQEMFKNQVSGFPGLTVALSSSRKELTSDFIIPKGMQLGWGITWMLNLDPLPTGRSALSAHWAGLPNLYYTADPTKGVALILMCQQIPFGDPAVLTTFLSLEGAVYASLA